MDHRDADMMETVAPPPESDAALELLGMASRLITEGKPSEALQAVLMAVKTRGGDAAVFQLLHRARELYISKLQEATAVDQLASLFAGCAIAEAQPLDSEPLMAEMGNPPVAFDACGTSILAETGRMQIVLDAFSDGSSFICLQCGGLVSKHRREEHYAYWCSHM